jgi:hypothetical protein
MDIQKKIRSLRVQGSKWYMYATLGTYVWCSVPTKEMVPTMLQLVALASPQIAPGRQV